VSWPKSNPRRSRPDNQNLHRQHQRQQGAQRRDLPGRAGRKKQEGFQQQHHFEPRDLGDILDNQQPRPADGPGDQEAKRVRLQFIADERTAPRTHVSGRMMKK
jgi:hypothetical protein